MLTSVGRSQSSAYRQVIRILMWRANLTAIILFTHILTGKILLLQKFNLVIMKDFMPKR